MSDAKHLQQSCAYFMFYFYPAAGDNGNGVAIIYTQMQYDREEQKYYEIPIIMWDMYGSGSSLTGTNTLTVTIADKNDNSMREGHQDIFVFNYEGLHFSFKLIK